LGTFRLVKGLAQYRSEIVSPVPSLLKFGKNWKVWENWKLVLIPSQEGIFRKVFRGFNCSEVIVNGPERTIEGFRF